MRVNGGIPATVGVLKGVARVGLEAEEITDLAASAGDPNTKKISRRDLGFICGLVIFLIHFHQCDTSVRSHTYYMIPRDSLVKC